MFKTNNFSKAGILAVVLAVNLTYLLTNKLGFEHLSENIYQTITFVLVLFGMERLFKSIILIFLPDSKPDQHKKFLDNKKIVQEVIESR